LSDEKDDFFYIDEETNEKMKSTKLKTGDILINIVGATTDVIGRTAFITKDFPASNITQAMAFCRVKNDQVLPEYLFIFLQSSFGKIQTKHIARPTGQYNLNLDELGFFKIPIPTKPFQEKISEMVQIAHAEREKSKKLYSEAEEILLEELSLKNWKPTEKNTAVKDSEEVRLFGRCDAEFFQPKYDEMFEKLSKVEVLKLENIVDYKKGVEPGTSA